MSVCVFPARRCWLFLLDSCCVSGRVTAVSSANVISCSVGCESISFQGAITEDCRFFFHPSNHNIWIKSLCAAQHTVPDSKHINCSVPWTCYIYDRPFQFPSVLSHSKIIPHVFWPLFSESINTTPDPGELWLRAFTLLGHHSQTICWMDGR